MLKTRTFDKTCPVSGKRQLVTVYFENTATNGIQDFSNYKRHHFVCNNQDCPAKLNPNACPRTLNVKSPSMLSSSNLTALLLQKKVAV